MGRRSWHVLAALALATAALGGLSIQAVRREAEMRAKIVVDAHRGVADLVSARLNEAIADDTRAIQQAVEARREDGHALVETLNDLEARRPWLRPLAIVASRTQTVEPSGHESSGPGADAGAEFDKLLAGAERTELQGKRFDDAIEQYRRAATEALSRAYRLQVLNGLARTELKAHRPGAAAAASQQLLAVANPLDPREARWALLAYDRLIDCDAAAGSFGLQGQHALALYDFLVRFRYVLDRDEVVLYARRAAEFLGQATLTPAERATSQQLRDREALLMSLDATIPESDAVGSTESQASVAYPLRMHAEATLQHVLAKPGPWSGRGIALVDTDGRLVFSTTTGVTAPDAAAATTPLAQPANWRVMAFPSSGTLDDLAARDVRRYTLWLVLVFGTVVAALALAARSVSRELALARLRADFVAGVSHELKTPLSLIRMFGESLREGWVDEAQKKDYYEVITRESERLTGLINNVLDFSRLESGTRRYAFDTIDLRQLMADLLDRYEFHLRAASIELVRDLSDQPVYARADRDAIEQVLVNLLSNAVKYMGDRTKDPRQVRVSLAHDAHDVVLRVADTGIGIPDEQRRHIFERFYRADDERVRAVAGSGLGLTLVKAHVDAHAGTIAVESAPGQGSTFAVSLPLAVSGTDA